MFCKNVFNSEHKTPKNSMFLDILLCVLGVLPLNQKLQGVDAHLVEGRSSLVAKSLTTKKKMTTRSLHHNWKCGSLVPHCPKHSYRTIISWQSPKNVAKLRIHYNLQTNQYDEPKQKTSCTQEAASQWRLKVLNKLKNYSKKYINILYSHNHTVYFVIYIYI